MADWLTKKTEFVTRKNALDIQSVGQLVLNLNRALSQYVSSKTIRDHETLIAARNKLKELKDSYATLHTDMMAYINTKSSVPSVGNIVTSNAMLLEDIKQLENKQKSIQIDVESALAREEVLRSRMQDVSRHQLFLLDRPVRRGMIPYLWVLSILFVGVGVYIFRIVFPPLPAEGFAMLFSSVSNEVLTNTTVLYTLIGCLLLTVLFLVLKILGLFGK
jgi:hypothetical protein